MLQETKLKPNEEIKCASVDDYQVYYLNRQNMQGGGIALGVNKSIESTLINEGGYNTEILSVKIQMENMKVRAITAYGPQENAPKNKKNNLWDYIEKEVIDAELEQEGLIMQMDGNLHAGPDLIEKDPNKQNQNGKILIESDHNALILEIDINEGKEKPKREEIFNLRNRVCQEAFRAETETNEKLLNCFNNNLKIDQQFEIWKQSFDDILRKCFKKIRIAPKKIKTKTEHLLKERFQLKKKANQVKMDELEREKINKRIKDIENGIEEDEAHENYLVVVETLKEIGEEGDINGSGRRKMWAMLKKKFPRITKSTPVAKRDFKGNLITQHQGLRKL